VGRGGWAAVPVTVYVGRRSDAARSSLTPGATAPCRHTTKREAPGPITCCQSRVVVVKVVLPAAVRSGRRLMP